jgi:hypothetical protein
MDHFDEYQEALNLLEKGDKIGAVKKLRSLWQSSPESVGKLDVGTRLLALLNRVDDHKELIQLGVDVETLAMKLGHTGAAAYAAGIHALTLTQKLPTIFHRMKNITLPRGWFNFALIIEKEEYEDLEKKVKEVDDEVEALFKRALELSKNDTPARANVYQFQTQAYENRITWFDFQNLKMPPLWLYHLSKAIGLPFHFLFNRKARAQRKKLLHRVDTLYKQTMTAYRASNDRLGEAYLYYTWTQHHKLQFRFFRAKETLLKSEKIARELNDQLLLNQIELLKKSLALKNRDISGEDPEEMRPKDI